MSWSTKLKNRQQIQARIDSGSDIAVLFSDIRGFTSYTAREGDDAAYKLSQVHTSLLDERIGELSGIIVKTMGDGIMTAFTDPQVAIEAAVGIQRATRARNSRHPTDPIDVGIGIATGTPVMTDADLIGHSVNLSQRISSLAKGGQILVSERIRETTDLSDTLHYLSLGKCELRGLEKEHVYEVAWMSESSRVSDAENKVTLVLTSRGTIVVELAKELQEVIDRTIENLEQGENPNTFSSLIQRSIARFTRKMIDSSLGAFGIAREQPLAKVDVSLDRDTLSVKIGRKTLPLRGVNPSEAAAFMNKLKAAKERS